MKGSYPKAEYTLTQTIKPLLPLDQNARVELVKLSPGGRFLFVKIRRNDAGELRLFDLEGGARWVWTASFVIGSGDFKFGFEIRHDGSIILVLALYGRIQGEFREDETVYAHE